MEHSAFVRPVPGSTKAVVFIHGICGTPRHFDFLIPLVPEDWSVYNLLLEGHGGTIDDFSNARMSQWQTQIDRFLAQLDGTYDQIVIAGHSRGTLLALNAAQEHAGVQKLFLLAVPLVIHPRLQVSWNCLQLALNIGDHTGPQLAAAKRCCGIALDKRLWKYLRWIPNFWSLLRLSRITRANSSAIQIPVTVLQSERDELVSLRSLRYLPSHAEKVLLPGSGHYFYSNEDTKKIQNAFSSLFI